MSFGKYFSGGRFVKLGEQTVQSLNITPESIGITPQSLEIDKVDNVKQMPISGGTFTGVAKAQTNTSYTNRQIRNIIYSTIEPTNTDGENGDLWIVYE